MGILNFVSTLYHYKKSVNCLPTVNGAQLCWPQCCPKYMPALKSHLIREITFWPCNPSNLISDATSQFYRMIFMLISLLLISIHFEGTSFWKYCLYQCNQSKDLNYRWCAFFLNDTYYYPEFIESGYFPVIARHDNKSDSYDKLPRVILHNPLCL